MENVLFAISRLLLRQEVVGVTGLNMIMDNWIAILPIKLYMTLPVTVASAE